MKNVVIRSPQPHEYKRLQVTIYMDFKVIEAWAYVYNLSPTGLKPILSGCFIKD